MTKNPANQAVIQYTYAGAHAPVVRLSNAPERSGEAGALTVSLTSLCPGFAPCSPVTLLIYVRNGSRHPVKDVRIADVLRGANQLNYLPASALLFMGGEPMPVKTGTPLSFDLPGTIPPGGNAMVLFSATPSEDCISSPLSLHLSVSVLAIDAATGKPLTASDSIVMTRCMCADLAVFKRDSEEGIEFVLTNSGGAAAEQVRLVDALRSEFEVASVELASGGEKTTLSPEAYSIDSARRLTIPVDPAEPLTVPPATDEGPGQVIIFVRRVMG